MGYLRILTLLFFVVFCAECSSKKGEKGVDLDYDTKVLIRQYIAAGRQLYIHNCSNCHQPEGEGLAALYPPLRNADYVKQNISALPCIIKNGHKGEIVVNGTTFNQEMPPNSNLTNLELSELSTFLLNEFNDTLMIADQREVEKYLENCDSTMVKRDSL